eukprot:6431653-Amphidinium_carterae.1
MADLVQSAAGKEVMYYQVSDNSLDQGELEQLWPSQVEHLAIDLRHCAGAQRLASLEATLEVAQRAQQTLVVDVHFCDWVQCKHIHTLLHYDALFRIATLYITAGGVKGLEDDTLLELAQALPKQSQMVSLTLDLGSYASCKPFTNEGVLEFAKTLRETIDLWHRLRSIAVVLTSGANKISAGAFAPLADMQDGLEEVLLGLPASTEITDEFFAEDIDDDGEVGFPEFELSEVIRPPESLRELSLDFGASSKITDAG